MRRRAIIRELFHDLFMFAVFFCILSPPLYYFCGSMRQVWLASALIVPFWGMTAARQIRNLPLFAAAHLALTVWPLLLPFSLPIRLLLLGFMILSIYYSIITRLDFNRGFNLPTIIAGVAVSFLMWLIAGYFGLDAVFGTLHVCVFVMLACFFVFNQSERLDESLAMLHDNARQPVKVTMRFNNAIIPIFLLLCAGAALLSGLVPLRELLGIIGNVFRIILRPIFWLLGRGGDPSADEMVMEEAVIERSRFYLPLPDAQSSFLTEIFNFIIEVLGLGILIVFVVFIIWNIIKRFYAYNPPISEDVREYIGPFDSKAKKSRRVRLPFFGESREEKIRRAYYKKVSRHIKRGAGVRGSDTTGEIGDKLLGREDISEITREYDRARYGE